MENDKLSQKGFAIGTGQGFLLSAEGIGGVWGHVTHFPLTVARNGTRRLAVRSEPLFF